MNIDQLSLSALTNIRNDINGTPNGGKFKTSREKAVEQLKRLAKEKGVNLSKQYDADGNRVKAEAAKPKAGKASKEKPAKEKAPVIRVVAEELLMQVVGKDDDGRPQGRSYASVLEEIHERFPGSATSVACLRWYAVRMRERGDKVPNRPRAKPEAAAEE